MSTSLKLVRVSDGNKITIKSMTEGKKPVYPSSWFAANQGKPVCIIPKLEKNDLRILREYLKKQAEENEKVNFDAAMNYMLQILATLKMKSPTEWKSYGVKIADEGTEITPLNLIEVKWGPDNNPDITSGNGIDGNEALDKWLMIWLLSTYRIEKASDPTYRRQIATSIERQMALTGIDSETVSLEQVSSKHASWSIDQSFRVLVAAVDMFFYKFEKSTWASLRISTTGSRFRDCAALVSYGMISGVMGLKRQGELALWMFTDTLSSELMQMFSTDEEFDVDDSYFPYQMDFGLTPRSPYSSRINPCIYFFCHVIGVLQGEKRSQNARMTLQKDIIGVLHNARLVGYVFMSKTGRSIQFVEESAATANIAARTTRASASEDYELGIEPAGRSPVEWFAYYDGLDGKPNLNMITVFQSVMSTLINQRADTIGEFLKTNLYR
ncbi:nucleoprotein [Yushu rhabdovirus]|uniref:Nucleoprotein n=1 Tax=Yushu rhabdovirus TaxID=3071240 RepID=A0AA48X9J4_9RHAB|nr:nucleoprotein [Rhabdoviridae sp.]QXV86584.1 nucleoprotein [Yushu rhabdovirus]